MIISPVGPSTTPPSATSNTTCRSHRHDPPAPAGLRTRAPSLASAPPALTASPPNSQRHPGPRHRRAPFADNRRPRCRPRRSPYAKARPAGFRASSDGRKRRAGPPCAAGRAGDGRIRGTGQTQRFGATLPPAAAAVMEGARRSAALQRRCRCPRGTCTQAWTPPSCMRGRASSRLGGRRAVDGDLHRRPASTVKTRPAR